MVLDRLGRVDRVVQHGDTYHRLVGPDALVKVRDGPAEAAGVEQAAIPAMKRPSGHRLAQIIDARPDERADVVVLLEYLQVGVDRVEVVEGISLAAVVGVSLRADDNAVGRALTVAFEPRLLVVETDDVRGLDEVEGQPGKGGAGHLARRVELVNEVGQSLENLPSPFGLLLADLVAHALEHDGRVVPVASNHGTQILLPVPLEMGVESAAPFVEGLIDDQKPQAVAHIEQLRSGRVMGHANGVAAHGLEDFETAFRGAIDERRAESAQVVMDTDTVHLHRLAVDQKSAVAVPFDRADAERRFDGIDNLIFHRERHVGVVQRGGRDRPQNGVFNWQLVFEASASAPFDFRARRDRGDNSAVSVDDIRPQGAEALLRSLVLDLRADADRR